MSGISASSLLRTVSGALHAPKLHKGALCQGPMIIPFQYNPETLTRTLTANSMNNTLGNADSLRLKAPPTETIQLDILLDASDQLDRGVPMATSSGIYPALSALELLLYPFSGRMVANSIAAKLGLIELIPPAPLPTLLVWGQRRVVPVRITSFTIVEQNFDVNLCPIRASVTLGLQVLTYEDLGMASVGGFLSLRNHVLKEKLGATFLAATDRTLISAMTGGIKKR